MNVSVNGTRRTGPAVDLTDCPVTPEQVAAGIRGDTTAVAVDCDEPAAVYEHVGIITPEMSLTLRPALAAAARSRGHSAPQAEQLADVRSSLAALDSPDIDLRSARKRVADASGDEAALRERVAALRGRVEALREVDTDQTEAEAELRRATRRLSEAETERLAAEQTLERARAAARKKRTALKERLRLEDRAANLARNAQRELARKLHDEFTEAVERVPGTGTVGREPATFDGDDVTAALAVAQLAETDAPIVLRCNRFDSANEAAACLDGPVIVL